MFAYSWYFYQYTFVRTSIWNKSLLRSGIYISIFCQPFANRHSTNPEGVLYYDCRVVVSFQELVFSTTLEWNKHWYLFLYDAVPRFMSSINTTETAQRSHLYRIHFTFMFLLPRPSFPEVAMNMTIMRKYPARDAIRRGEQLGENIITNFSNFVSRSTFLTYVVLSNLTFKNVMKYAHNSANAEDLQNFRQMCRKIAIYLCSAFWKSSSWT